MLCQLARKTQVKARMNLAWSLRFFVFLFLALSFFVILSCFGQLHLRTETQSVQHKPVRSSLDNNWLISSFLYALLLLKLFLNLL